MSRAVDLERHLKNMLLKYDCSFHTAIVETFGEVLDEGFDDEIVLSIYQPSKFISIEADAEIYNQLRYRGIKQ